MYKSKLYWILQLSCWGIYVTYAALGIFYYQPNAFAVLSAALLNFILLVLGTHSYRLVVRAWNIESLSWYHFLVYPVIGNLLITSLLCVFNAYFLNFGKIFSPNHDSEIWYYFLQFLDTFRFLMPWFIFYHGVKFAKKAIKNERDKIEAQMQLKVAALDNLKNQLNPHFLFNSLNSIRSLTLTDPKMAREATTKLSDLLRISLTYTDNQYTTLQEELKLVKDYLSLEKIRFEERLNYRVDINKELLNALVPPMSLQLLAENAVKHGVSKVKNGGEISVFAQKKGDFIIFGVKNTGTLSMSNGKHHHRKGIGLDNLQKRLQLNYGEENGFKIFTENNLVISEICIPLRMN
ncbi:MAG: histidine kinase [Arcicella sp.]|jgi:hypothetical protein|nr:histidine kinase [Arcicella sp.]